MRRLLKGQVSLGIISAFIVAWTAISPIDAAFALDPLEAGGAACDNTIPTVGVKNLSECVPAGTTPDFVIGQKPTINGCTRVKVDRSFTQAAGNALGKITIDPWGSLFFPDQTVELETKGMDVSGTLQAGTAQSPIGTANPTNKVTITFTGSRPSSEDHTKGIVLQKGGRLMLCGAKGVPTARTNAVSWTHLSEAAGPLDKYGGTVTDNPHNIGRPVPKDGDTNLHLAKDVSTGAGAWQKDDWIAVATTSFSPFETEFVQIAEAPTSDGKGGSTVKLKQKLLYYHFGGPDPGSPGPDNFIGPNATKNDKDHNWGVDERAEVGLISRNMKLTARIEPGDTNKHWGGEIRVLEGFRDLDIQGVEIEKFGKDQLGSYPIHLHQTKDLTNTPPIINANSVHHSFNKCVTIHSTQNVTIQNMVCARIVGHIFYQEFGDESGISFLNNLGLGAMSHYFGIADGTSADRKAQFWGGDYLANAAGFGYDGFNVPNTDAQTNPVRGACNVRIPQNTTTGETGELALTDNVQGVHPNATGRGDCSKNKEGKVEYYVEPASGFWIIHPGTHLEGNSIGGCQGVGRGYWYVPPKNDAAVVPEKLRDHANIPIGTFKNNRVHGCYTGLYAEDEFGVYSEQLKPTTTQKPGGKNLITTFDGLTATRIRDRGIWVRPGWTVLKNARFATNKASVILVSAGGLDGVSPGIWTLLTQTVFVGLSENNVDRWGPCKDLYSTTSKGLGCVDLTTAATDIVADGYPLPAFTMFGYQIYDGPPRITDTRFVNFIKDVAPHLTVEDKTFLSTYTGYFPVIPPDPNVKKSRYEGDAAFGWFKVNQSAYPNASIVERLTFTNVDLRHEIFTQQVNFGDFQDGDRNTVVLDGDGSLTGFEVVRIADNKKVDGALPVSLNNLGFNHAANSVDECLAEGQQDTDLEGRPTSLISPLGIATLEFQAAFPDPEPKDPGRPPTKQLLTFTKDYKEFCLDTTHPELCQHQSMPLTSRDRRGIWEPKVVSGYGYTVAASKCADPPACTTGDAGIPARVSVGVADAVGPEISKDNPFVVRLGICYTNSDGTTHPADGNFTITRGYRSWGGGIVETSNLDLRKYFNRLNRQYPKVKDVDVNTDTEICDGLDSACEGSDCKNLRENLGCPAHGLVPVQHLPGQTCPADARSIPEKDRFNLDVCVFEKHELTKLVCSGTDEASRKQCLAGLTHDQFYYDKDSGMLYFYVVQESPNAVGPSPLGSCTESSKDPCPDVAKGETYYTCPPQGCNDYAVRLHDSTYKPGPSNCTPYPTFETSEPAAKFKLVYKGTTTPVEFVQAKDDKALKFPHYEAKTAPVCPITTPTSEEVEGGEAAQP